MAYLAERTHTALLEGNKTEALRHINTQQIFLEDHLKQWVSKFCADVTTFAQTTFYREVASMTDEQIKADQVLLVEVLTVT